MKKPNEIKRNWWLVDVKDKVLGRISSEIASLLRGKHKPIFVPYKDVGDYVVVINAKDLKITGKKLEQKIYFRHSGHLGGLKKERLKDLMEKNPGKIIMMSVSGMLPKNKLKKFWLKRLYIYQNEKHPFKEKLKIKN